MQKQEDLFENSTSSYDNPYKDAGSAAFKQMSPPAASAEDAGADSAAKNGDNSNGQKLSRRDQLKPKHVEENLIETQRQEEVVRSKLAAEAEKQTKLAELPMDTHTFL